VMNNCYRDGQGFALKDALDAAQPIYDFGGGEKLYFANQINGIDVEKLAYFAASVFWRASGFDNLIWPHFDHFIWPHLG
jgi:hypothetical protein